MEKKQTVKPQVLREVYVEVKQKSLQNLSLFCLSDLTPRLKSHQSHHKDWEPTWSFIFLCICAPYTPPAQAAHPACCPEMPRDRLEGVCRISAWQLWESKARVKVRPK